MNKKISNPYGKKGSPEHQNLILKIKQMLEQIYKRVRREYKVPTTDNKSRVLDIVALNDDGSVAEYHQIGKQNKNGEPVARERKAIQEIEKATGKKVFFHAYNILKLFIFIIFVASLVILVSSMN